MKPEKRRERKEWKKRNKRKEKIKSRFRRNTKTQVFIMIYSLMKGRRMKIMWILKRKF